MAEFEELPMTRRAFTSNDLQTIKNLWDAIRQTEAKLRDKDTALNDKIAEESESRPANATVQNKQIRLRIYRDQIHQAKLRNQHAYLRLSELEKESAKQGDKQRSLETSVVTENKNAQAKEVALAKLRSQLNTLKNEFIYRKRYMLFELYSIYFLDTTILREKTCSCVKHELIRGLHLPRCMDRQGHNEVELTAALGHVVNVLVMVGQILEYSFNYPLFFKGSRSFVLDSDSHQIYLLADPFSRSHKERFAHAFFLLNRNIVQLRYDLGLSTREADRPILNVREAILCCIGKTTCPSAHLVNKNFLLAPGTVVPDPALVATSNNTTSITRSPVLSSRSGRTPLYDDDDDSIIDVVSAKNETFDVRQLCRNRTQT